jgi:PAS domain S-box-containing protein
MSARDPVNILLVDDQPAKLLSYEVMLSELGENLLKAGSAREAMEQLLKTEIAVVVTDVSMPELDGFDLAAMIREHPRFENTAIIFVSAINLEDVDRLRGFHLGAVDYITVPVAPELLRAKVKVFAELYRKTKQLEQLTAELEQRVAERTAALNESEKRLREALRLNSVASEAGRAAAWHIDVETSRLTCSDELLDLIGIDKSQFDGGAGAVETVTHPDDIERRRNDWAKALAEGDQVAHDFRIIRPDGEVRWMHSRGNIMRRADGAAVEAYGVILDITERKQTEEQQRLRLAELDHRLNNTLAYIGAVVERSIAEHTRANAASVEALSTGLTGRLDAVVRAQMRLSRDHSTGLRQLVEDELAPYRNDANAKSGRARPGDNPRGRSCTGHGVPRAGEQRSKVWCAVDRRGSSVGELAAHGRV